MIFGAGFLLISRMDEEAGWEDLFASNEDDVAEHGPCQTFSGTCSVKRPGIGGTATEADMMAMVLLLVKV